MSLRKARQERRAKQKSLVRVFLLAAAVILVLGIIYQLTINAHTALTRIIRDIERVEYGCLEDKLTGKAIVINHEELVFAQIGGHFENLVKEGEKVSKDALLGYLIGAQDKIPLRAKLPGIYVAHIDGLEETFRTMSLKDVTEEQFSYQTTPHAADRPIEAGQAIFKIVDSLQPTRLLIEFKLDEADFEVLDHQAIQIRLAGKELGKATITGVKQEENRLYLVAECSSFREELLNLRYIDLEAVFNSYCGYLIPEKSLVEREDKKGVYCSNGEDITFKPVKVIEIKGDIAVVEGLDQNDLLVKNPPDSKTVDR